MIRPVLFFLGGGRHSGIKKGKEGLSSSPHY